MREKDLSDAAIRAAKRQLKAMIESWVTIGRIVRLERAIQCLPPNHFRKNGMDDLSIQVAVSTSDRFCELRGQGASHNQALETMLVEGRANAILDRTKSVAAMILSPPGASHGS